MIKKRKVTNWRNALLLICSTVLIGAGLLAGCGGSSGSSTGQTGSTGSTQTSKHWAPLGDGVNNCVLALVVDDYGFLFAGGEFSSAGQVSADYIAKWEMATQTWSTLANGTDGIVHALAYHFGNVYAGGLFMQPGAAVARWNIGLGQWMPMDRGLATDAVLALATADNGNLVYAGGNFTYINSNSGWIECNHIAVWDGASWTNTWLGGLDNWVWALSSNPEEKGVFIGGSFSTIPDGFGGTLPSGGITNWGGPGVPLPGLIGSGMELQSGDVYAVAYDYTDETEDTLYVGGDFDGFISQYKRGDSGYWSISRVGDEANGKVRALALDYSTGDLYAGGDFTVIGGVSANHIARWDGNTWEALETGVDGPVDAIVYDSYEDAARGIKPTLYVGGDFTHAGGGSANHIAMWR